MRPMTVARVVVARIDVEKGVVEEAEGHGANASDSEQRGGNLVSREHRAHPESHIVARYELVIENDGEKAKELPCFVEFHVQRSNRSDDPECDGALGTQPVPFPSAREVERLRAFAVRSGREENCARVANPPASRTTASTVARAAARCSTTRTSANGTYRDSPSRAVRLQLELQTADLRRLAVAHPSQAWIFATTASGVKPNFSASTLSGALAP